MFAADSTSTLNVPGCGTQSRAHGTFQYFTISDHSHQLCSLGAVPNLAPCPMQNFSQRQQLPFQLPSPAQEWRTSSTLTNRTSAAYFFSHCSMTVVGGAAAQHCHSIVA